MGLQHKVNHVKPIIYNSSAIAKREKSNNYSNMPQHIFVKIILNILASLFYDFQMQTYIFCPFDM